MQLSDVAVLERELAHARLQVDELKAAAEVGRGIRSSADLLRG